MRSKDKSAKPVASLRDDWRLYRRLLSYAWPYRWIFALAIFGMFLSSLTTTGTAALMKPLVDQGFIERKAETMRFVPVALLLLAVAFALTNLLGQYAITWVSRQVTFDLRTRCFAHLLRLPCGFFDLNASGRVITRFTYHLEQISASITQALITLVGDGIKAAALLGYMFWLEWRLTLMMLILTPVSGLVIRQMGRAFRRKSEKIQALVGEISRVTQETSQGYRVVKAFGAEARVSESFKRVNERNRRENLRKKLISAGGDGLIQIMGALALAVVIYGALAVGDTLTTGGFASFVAATGLLTGPLRHLAKVNETIQTGLAAASNTFKLLDEIPEQDDGTIRLTRAQGRVEFRNASFRYPAGHDDAVRDVSFVVEPGQTVALVGASGSGKTTLSNLVPRFYRPTAGTILLDNIDLNDIELASLRAQIALVGQDTLLFDDTLANNIAYSEANEVDRERVAEAARVAHVLEFAERMPLGLDTKVGERGGLLSGGQRQRIAIARALYKNAPVLILDEATSALDTESERLVQDAMRRLLVNRTTIVIAHRLSTVEHADRIVVLSQGRVAETGTHRELLARGGAYARLYQMQFSDAASA